MKGEMMPDVQKPTVIHHFQEAEMVLNLVGLFEICGRRMEGLKGFHIPFFFADIISTVFLGRRDPVRVLLQRLRWKLVPAHISKVRLFR